MDDNAVRPFRIEILDAAIQDLHDRLDRARWPDELPDVGWGYGTPLGYLKELANYWRNEFDWREHEATLNAYDQFTTTIDGANVHFLHVKSPQPNARPLLITHGWPGSVAEFLRILGPLTDPAAHGGDPADAFHVVAPSIPGYGFSGPTTETGWDLARIGNAFAELMTRLGYERYGVHGGDWGAMISRSMGIGHADRITGRPPQHAADRHPAHRADRGGAGRPERAGAGAAEAVVRAHDAVHPRRFGVRDPALDQAADARVRPARLAGRPAGLDRREVQGVDRFPDRPEDAVDRDQMLTNISIYWFTGTAGSSARLYYESAHAGSGWRGKPQAGTAPTGVAVFPAELSIPIRRLAEQSDHIVHWAEYDHGGHFAAMEQPNVLVDDIRTFFRAL